MHLLGRYKDQTIFGMAAVIGLQKWLYMEEKSTHMWQPWIKETSSAVTNVDGGRGVQNDNCGWRNGDNEVTTVEEGTHIGDSCG